MLLSVNGQRPEYLCSLYRHIENDKKLSIYSYYTSFLYVYQENNLDKAENYTIFFVFFSRHL